VTAERKVSESVLRQCGRLSLVTMGLWCVLAYPAFLLRGLSGLEGLTYALILCLLPGWLVFWLASRYGVAKSQAMAVLAGTVLRLLFVLCGVVVIRAVRTNLGFWEFLVWVLTFYLATLFVETLLIVKRSS